MLLFNYILDDFQFSGLVRFTSSHTDSNFCRQLTSGQDTTWVVCTLGKMPLHTHTHTINMRSYLNYNQYLSSIIYIETFIFIFDFFKEEINEFKA